MRIFRSFPSFGVLDARTRVISCVCVGGGVISQSGSFIGVMHELELFGASCWQGLLENAVLWGGGGSGQNQRGTGGEGLVRALLVQLSLWSLLDGL